jgi:dihydroxyacid dehydratase/phosphogluconate dehydratase
VIKTGDTISIDVKKRRLDLELPVAEIKKRLKT